MEERNDLIVPERPEYKQFESGLVIQYLDSITDDYKQALELNRLARVADDVGYKGFIRLWQKFQKKKSQQQMRVIDDNNVSEFYAQPFELNTGTWRCDETGIWRYAKNGPEYACSHPVMPVRLMKGIDTKQIKVELWYRYLASGKKDWESVIVDMKDIASATSIVNRLASIGISVTSGPRANAMVDYLRDMIDLNRGRLPEVKSVSRMGWNEEGFSPYTSGLLFDGMEKFRKVYEAITQAGTMDGWMNVALEIRKYSLTARIVLAASFASVLVEPLGCLPFFVHLWSVESGSGKTVTQMLAASVWAEPSAGGAYFQTFKGTDVGFELLAGFLHSLPMFLDDLQLKKDNRGRTNFSVYDLASGAGKLRANKELGINYTPEWKNCFITSGETPIVSDTDGAGALNRVIEIECSSEDKPIRDEDGHRVANALRENYGWAGKLFVERLSEPGSIEMAKTLYEAYYGACSKNDTTNKQAMAAAVILVADRLATEWVFKDKHELSVTDISKFLKERANVSIGARGYEILCGWVSANVHNFLRTVQDDDGTRHEEREYGECYGAIEDDGAYTIAYINRTVFDRFCQEHQLPTKGFLSHLRANNLIETGAKGFTRTKRINGVLTSCVWVRIENMKENLQESDEMLPL